MKTATVILFMVCSLSCTSFDRLHYRHIRKVPASPALIEANAEVRAEEDFRVQEAVNSPDSVIPLLKTETSLPVVAHDTIIRQTDEALVLMDSVTRMQMPLPVSAADPANGKRADLSLAVALVMITGGLLLLAFAVLVLPFTPIPLIAKIIFGLILGFAAARFIITGTAIFVNRFRTSGKYREYQSLHTQYH